MPDLYSATVEINRPSPEARRLWGRVLELAEALGREEPWALIGGLMVQLHGFEHGRGVRPTVDVDLLGDSRSRPAMTERIAEVLVGRGGVMGVPPVGDEKLGYRFTWEGEIVEVLGSEGVRRDPRTTSGHVTLQVPGGTQALRRAERVRVSLDGAPAVIVRRPSLLGAILLKARAVAAKRLGKFDSDRQDLLRLLSFVGDPKDLAARGGMSSKEAGWLRAVESSLEFEGPPSGGIFTLAERVAAAQVFQLLSFYSPPSEAGRSANT